MQGEDILGITFAHWQPLIMKTAQWGQECCQCSGLFVQFDLVVTLQGINSKCFLPLGTNLTTSNGVCCGLVAHICSTLTSQDTCKLQHLYLAPQQLDATNLLLPGRAK